MSKKIKAVDIAGEVDNDEAIVEEKPTEETIIEEPVQEETTSKVVKPLDHTNKYE